MHLLLEANTEEFGGMFSVLKLNGEPAAMHLGMRSRDIWHCWTTGYNPRFSRYSPGMQMQVEILKAAPRLGLLEVDLGKEEFEYKRRLHTHLVPLVEGAVVFERGNGND